MRFLEIHNKLNEASQEYNIAKVLTDKIIKTMKEMAYDNGSNLRHYDKYKNQYSKGYRIPMIEFIKDVKVPDDGVFNRLKKGRVFFEEGHFEFGDQAPWLYAHDGNKKVQAGGYFTPDGIDFGIHIPFIDHETGKPFMGFFPEYRSLIIHELTHFIQNAKEKFTTGTAQLSREDWFKNKKEQEAYLHELYNDIQEHVKETLREMKSYRSAEWKTPEYGKYVNYSNTLFKMFEDVDSFKKSINMLQRIIFLNNIKNKNKFTYLSTEHRDVYNKFLEDSFAELKKEFKNVLPTKKLTYGEKK